MAHQAKAQVEKDLLEEGLHRSPSRVRSRSESGSGSALLQVELHGHIKAITAHPALPSATSHRHRTFI